MMFSNLYFKECKRILKSIIYFAFVFVVIVFYITQLGNFTRDNTIIKPAEGVGNYGFKDAEIKEQVMPNAISSLINEYRENRFITYPFGFIKTIKLDEKNLKEIEKILNEIAGFPNSKPINISYEEFKEKMNYIDKILGGGSNYAQNQLKKYGKIAITYEEKIKEYDDFIEKDKISGAYARLFCDYMGLTIALFSIFIPVWFFINDRRVNINELLYSRRITSTKIIIVRYFAIVTMMVLPYLFLSIIPTIQLIDFGAKNGFTIDNFAFIKYIFSWLMPSILTTTAVGIFFTVLTDTPIGILMQFLFSFLTIGTNKSLDGGDYGFQIAIRHNSLGNLQLVIDNMRDLIINRASYVMISILLVMLTILIYDLKRRRKINVTGKLKSMFRDFKGSAKANNSI